ncbi:conserved hypothetical protein [Leishmania braziliensis MHOM/BR/75/M2904]|uniref:Uncharacterized protein n=1 Tax=Leishmania braziliensis TaxID=5660 RepID=A4HB83_LEIBR|nr:conserved hypothetical protein [Leishmania braziliensis MHOM/BR/75/M2904]CAJ2471641.1 unnamed protein product [Leishmania braziliensis]CAM38669.1 conserved hypothetical protein [Leishmania braziliensis MHOM/BR/75/M2904]
MFSMTKFILATAITVAAVAFPGAAMEFAMAETTTMTAAPISVNRGVNMAPVALVLGVSMVVALIYALWKVLPKTRSGELSSSKIHFDWRAELLNQTPKKVRGEKEVSDADMV